MQQMIPCLLSPRATIPHKDLGEELVPSFQVSGKNSLALTPVRVGVPLLAAWGWALTVTACCLDEAGADSPPSCEVPNTLCR